MSPVNPPNLPNVFPATWARQWGQDKYGLFMVLEFKGIRQRFRWIKPGTFEMGSTENENEKIHTVTLTQGYWLADTTCTQALWSAVMGENPSQFTDSTENPVEQVSWNDTQPFIQLLNKHFPELYARLPTEAEWEYACRAGTTTAYSFGDEITTEQVNHNGDRTVPVKSLPANPWGLYEMHGNVLEWCEDWYGKYDPTVTADPNGPATGSHRVLRGGSWFGLAGFARSALRGGDFPGIRYRHFGFRLALGRKGVSQEGQG